MKIIYYFFALLTISTLLLSNTSEAVSDNGRAGSTGSPGETTCSSCHGGAGAGSATLTSDIPLSGFVPGGTYNISVTVSESGQSVFGLGVEALTTANANAGTLAISDAASTKLLSKAVSGVTRQNVVHQLNGGATANSKTFTFKWTAPAVAAGNVTFYYAGLAANGNGTDDAADHTYASSKVFTPQTISTPISATATATNVSCFGGTNGSATVTASGGTSYTYTWSNGQTSATATNLAAGTYTVTVTSGTQTATATTTVSQPTQLVSTISAPSPISCAAPTSTITAGASGGTAPYTYNWSTGATTSSISASMAGTYTVSITDAKGCTSSKSATVTGSCVVACPTFTAAPANVSIINSTCTSTCTVSAGSITAPTAACPTGSSLQYSVNGGAWTATLPTYTTTAQSIQTRCSCDSDATMNSTPSVAVVTAPAACTNLPSAPTLSIVNNVLPSLVGTITATGCGTGTVVEYAPAAAGPYTSVAPSYTTSPITVYARCNNTTTGCVSPSVSGTTAPVSANTVLTLNCPATITVTAAANATTAVANYTAPIGTSTCTTGSVVVTKTSGLASGSAFPIGMSTVCYTATDGCGNNKSCCFNVIVTNTTTPTNTAACNKIKIKDDDNSIEIDKLPRENNITTSIKITNTASGTIVFQCTNNCKIKKGTLKIKNISGGTYTVQVDLYQTIGGVQTLLCQKTKTVTVEQDDDDDDDDDHDIAMEDDDLEENVTVYENTDTQETNRANIKNNVLATKNSFGLYPNPAFDIVNIDVTAFKGQTVTINIFNQVGQIVKTQVVQKATEQQVAITLQGIADGFYTVLLQSNKEVKSNKFVVSRGH